MSHPKVAFDHLVVAAETLEDGVAFVENRTGITVPPGGVHQRMGTHNCVGRIGENVYLEIIAADPVTPPERTRWFSLDEPAVRDRLKSERAFLHHWVVNSSGLDESVAGASVDIGIPTPMSRGDLHWRITVRDDGVLAHGGLLPTIIEWPDGPHPSTRMTDLGARIERVTLHTADPAALLAELEAIGAADFATLVASQSLENRMTAELRIGDKIVAI